MPLGRILWRASHKGILIDTERVEVYKQETLELLKIGKIWNAKIPITSYNPPLYDGLNTY